MDLEKSKDKQKTNNKLEEPNSRICAKSFLSSEILPFDHCCAFILLEFTAPTLIPRRGAKWLAAKCGERADFDVTP